jgi:chromosome segregation protein
VRGILRDRVGGAAQAGAAVEARLGRAVLVDDLGRSLDLHAAWPGWSFVTAQGDVVHPDGVVAGGEGATVPHGLLARRAEALEITRSLSEVERDRRDHEAEAAPLREELRGLQERLGVAASALQGDERALFERQLRVQQRRGELDRIDRALPLLLGERERLAQELAGRDREAEELAAGITSAEGERADLEESIRTAAEALASRRAGLERVQGEAAEAKAAFAAGRQRLQALTREREAVEEAIRETRALAGRRAAERQEWLARAAALLEEEAALRGQSDAALKARAEEAAREEAAQAGLAYDRSLLHAREMSAREARAAHAALRDELQGLELHRARLDADLEHLARTCRDDLLTSMKDLRAAPEPADQGRTLEDEEKELERTRAEIDELGPVNLMAIEQHAELEERYTFLTVQKQDLEDSIASLQETIRKINRQSRERFMAAFEAIQANFQQVFTTLFGGGTARIRLQEGEDDVLEAGIEIAAQPPGKRLQALSLLSGGEKALTAVALLFSLFRYRPSPFCVLDEVDAPLDEANVGRFTDLLKALRQDTQFILITHNRKSMEAADLLYGVTMEEPGVSKVLPLRFE